MRRRPGRLVDAKTEELGSASVRPLRERGIELRKERESLLHGAVLAPGRIAGKDVGDTHIPSPRFLPKFHSMPPASRTVPVICWPMRLPRTGCHGTRWKLMP